MADLVSNSSTTYEEAKLCPKCKHPGEEVKLTDPPRAARLPLGTKIANIYCRNEPCPWFNTMWVVQLNADGTIPAPRDHTNSPKIYQGFEGHDEQAKLLIDGLRNDAARETSPDAEYRGPR